MFYGRPKKGFTLIELLVVMAIIGVLASIVVVNLNKTQARSRDARRVADFEAVKSALIMYKQDNKVFPENKCGLANGAGSAFCNFKYFPPANGNNNLYNGKYALQELEEGGYISALPNDPKRGYYYYWPVVDQNSTTSYLIGFMEAYSGTEGMAGSYRKVGGGINGTNEPYCRADTASNHYCLKL